MTIKSHYALVIIGAGPAGQAAAIIAANRGVNVAVFDEQPGPGGQIYRNIESIADDHAALLGKDYLYGKKLVHAFLSASIDYFPQSQIWSIDGNYTIGVTHCDNVHLIHAESVIIATGAMERPHPFPGWTLPGVMYAGACQILLKSSAIAPANAVVLAGSGPLLLLLATQYIKAGIRIKALLDTTPWENYFAALEHLPRAFRNHAYLLKGMQMQWQLIKKRTPVYYGVKHLSADGHDSLEVVSFYHRGQQHQLTTDNLIAHFGIIPHIWLSQSIGCKIRWDADQVCWKPVVDSWGNSSKQCFLIAGDSAGIDGAIAAEASGSLAGLEATFQLGRINQQTRDQVARPYLRQKQKERQIRPFLERLYRPPLETIQHIADSTLICRCEEITAGQIKQAINDQHTDSNALKFLLRCGMGPCQGRQCALPVAILSAACSNQSVSDTGHYRARPPIAPLSLAQLASLENKDAS